MALADPFPEVFELPDQIEQRRHHLGEHRRQISRGILRLVTLRATQKGLADPELPNKVISGRMEDIRLNDHWIRSYNTPSDETFQS